MSSTAKKTVICGATGMVGSGLARQLHAKGHRLALVGRDARKLRSSFPFEFEAWRWEDLAQADPAKLGTIVNLTGAGVSDERWTAEYKQLMRDSRLHTTEQCVAVCRRHPDIRLINASAVSAYGFYDQDHAPFTERDRDRRTGTNFLQGLIDDWEAAALMAGDSVVLLRIGVVLDRRAGALPRMAAPFRFFFGGPVGTGAQIMSWIGVRDLVNGIDFVMDHPDISGPVNLVAPGACSQRSFAKALGEAMDRPSFVPTPAFMIRALMGQLGQELVLTGQRVAPQILLEAGFTFEDPEIGGLLQRLFDRDTS